MNATVPGNGACGSRSATIATAPAAMAAETNCRPSALPPVIATNASPRLTVRLSAVTPPMSRSARCALNSASGGKISRSFMCPVDLVARSTMRPRPYLIKALPAFLQRGQYLLIGGRQVHAWRDVEERRNARDHRAADRHG